MSTETETKAKAEPSDDANWVRVREAITQRWPDINHDELADCPNDACGLTDFVRRRVEAGEEEVDAVVREFAPHESTTKQATQAAADTLHQASETAQSVYMRADDCIARRPTASVLTSFVAGIMLGATMTALWMRSKSKPTVCDRVKDGSWS